MSLAGDEADDDAEVEMNEILERLLTGAITLALLAWTWSRFQGRHDKLEERVASIEKTAMTREEFVQKLTEWSQDRREMHRENQTCLKEIRDQLIANEAKRHKTEHEILNVVNALTMKQAASEAVEKYRTRNDR